MTTITRHGDLGPIEALGLRDELVRAADMPRPHITLDLSGVDSLHPAAAAAIVAGAWNVRRTMGSFTMVEPGGYAARRTLSRVSISTLIL
jgi:hypothetical protein